MRNWQTFSIRKSNALFWIILTVLTLTAAVFSIALGSVKIAPAEVISVLLKWDVSSATGRIVMYSRLPHTIAAMLAGIGLSVAGVVIQTVLNNSLASPGIIGVNSSAGLAVALVCAVLPMAQRFVPLLAFLGALSGVLLIMGLSQYTGASKMTVILAGVAISNLFSAAIDMIVLLFPDVLNGVTDFRIGGFYNVSMEQLLPAGVMILLGVLLILSLSQQLDILALGSDVAKSLGLSVKPLRFFLLLLAAALAGAVVSFAGLISFVGLIVPHAMRKLIGEDSLPLLASSALGGAFFVMICDLLARLLFAPFELPVGIVLAFTGAPFFLWLLFKSKGRHS